MSSTPDGAEHDEHGHERGLQLVHAVGPAGQQVGGEEQQRELQQLGRLERERSRGRATRARR